MTKRATFSYPERLTKFDRNFFTGKEKFTYIGSGSIGGKAQGLARMREALKTEAIESFDPKIEVNIPTLTVVATDFFDLFMTQNDLYEIAFSEMRDDQKALAFQKADLPVQLVGDLRALISQVHTPLAIRSSSMLEDAMFEPFASVYETKMIPNNQHSTDERFMKLVETVKFIWASTFFRDASNYMRATKHTTADEKMAVVIQEVVGKRYGDRYYPHICGVARSYNFYPSGSAKPEEGVIDFALGLGKSIVDDGVAWSISPAHPKANPPFKSMNDMLKCTQTEFWAVNMGKPPAFDPVKETEYLIKGNLSDAEYDGTLKYITSTLRSQDGKLTIGTGAKGPRIIDFSPILKLNDIPLNNLLKEIIKMCEDELGSMVEIEFAVTLDDRTGTPARFGFLQVRPMVVSQEEVEVSPSELTGDRVLLASKNVLGNGILEDIRDVVYVKSDNFETSETFYMVPELEKVNRRLADVGKPYVLIGYGRWGTTDPVAGIPVNFGQISGAKVIVEATLPEMNFGLSQGSHFFHNITSFQILYFSVYHWDQYRIDWRWLDEQKPVTDGKYIRHVELESPLVIKVDGRSGRGVIYYG